MIRRQLTPIFIFVIFSLIFMSHLFVPTECARILGVSPFPSKSHMVVFSTVTQELARRGHEIVVVSPYPLEKPMANYTDIDISSSLEVINKGVKGKKMYDMAQMSMFQMPLMLWSIGLSVTNITLSHPQVKALLQDERGFDLVLVEAFFDEAIYSFADYFKAPLILIAPFGGFHFLNYYTANPAPPSYIPNTATDLTDRMDFWGRIKNTIVTAYMDVGQDLYYLPRQESIRHQTFGDGLRSVWEMQRSVSVIMVNSHYTLNYPRPLVPSFIEIGGAHVKRKIKKLPGDIENFIDEAKHGVIYFSMGSNLRSDEMPSEKRDALLSAFGELPQRVLWKWESDSLPGQPENVKLGRWFPQQDVLAHNNIVLFITHGGLLSIQESLYHGVPLVGIPIFGDQSLNMHQAESAGYGVLLNWKNVTKESVLWAVRKALDVSCRQEARRRSNILRDQLESPLDRAVFWTEYVIRHKGATHLRTAALDLSWYQVYLLDVWAFLLGSLLLSCWFLRALWRKWFVNSNHKVTSRHVRQARKKFE